MTKRQLDDIQLPTEQYDCEQPDGRPSHIDEETQSNPPSPTWQQQKQH